MVATKTHDNKRVRAIVDYYHFYFLKKFISYFCLFVEFASFIFLIISLVGKMLGYFASLQWPKTNGVYVSDGEEELRTGLLKENPDAYVYNKKAMMK